MKYTDINWGLIGAIAATAGGIALGFDDWIPGLYGRNRSRAVAMGGGRFPVERSFRIKPEPGTERPGFLSKMCQSKIDSPSERLYFAVAAVRPRSPVRRYQWHGCVVPSRAPFLQAGIF